MPDAADKSNGYERIAAEFLSGRGQGRQRGIGVKEVREWARSLPRGASVLDLGCGPGFPIAEILVLEGLEVFGVDGSPTFVEAFQRNLPGVPIVCEAVDESTFFGRKFDAVLAWGLIFLLPAEEQLRLIERVAAVLNPSGRFLFTAGDKPHVWMDAMTELESRLLGGEVYRAKLGACGLAVLHEYEDIGENYYFDAVKVGG